MTICVLQHLVVCGNCLRSLSCNIVDNWQSVYCTVCSVCDDSLARPSLLLGPVAINCKLFYYFYYSHKHYYYYYYYYHYYCYYYYFYHYTLLGPGSN